MLCNVQSLRPADWPSLCFPTAIHQRRHALLHPDPDEWQWEQRRERTNPHPRFPQDRSDAALHEPHRQHGTGCFRHVIVMWPCRMTRYRQGGAEGEHKDSPKKQKKIKIKTSDTMAVRFDPSISLAVDVHVQNKTYVYCQSALYELETDSHQSIFFFF